MQHNLKVGDTVIADDFFIGTIERMPHTSKFFGDALRHATIDLLNMALVEFRVGDIRGAYDVDIDDRDDDIVSIPVPLDRCVKAE